MVIDGSQGGEKWKSLEQFPSQGRTDDALLLVSAVCQQVSFLILVSALFSTFFVLFVGDLAV